MNLDAATKAIAKSPYVSEEFTVEFIRPGLPVVVSFAFVGWQGLPEYDFVNRLKRIEELSQRQLNKIFLKDNSNSWYHGGVKGLGSSIDEVARSLEILIQSMSPSQVICIGQSMGGYAAMVLGIRLQADTIISFGSLSCLDSNFLQLVQDTRWLPTVLELESRNFSCQYFDLVPLCQRKSAHTKIHYIFGSNHREETGDPNLDAVHASRLEVACPDMQIYGYPQSGHAIVKYLSDTHAINSLLLKLIFNIEEWTEAANLDEISETWQIWLATNLMRGGNPDELVSILERNGFRRHVVDKLLKSFSNHPAIKAGKEIHKTLQKREWLLTTLDLLRDLSDREVESKPTPPVAEFIRDYYSCNQPVILEDAIAHWLALHKWTPEFLQTQFGDLMVQIQDKRTNSFHYEREAHSYRTQIKLRDFVDRVLQTATSNDFYMTAGNSAENIELIRALLPDMGNIGDGYLDLNSQERSCLWLGPAGTITLLHHDLTNNLFIQVYGRKRIILIPSTQVAYLYNFNHVYSEVDPQALDASKFPDFAKARVYDFILHPGQALFIPIGWWHQVHALDVSISLTLTHFQAGNNYHNTYPKS